MCLFFHVLFETHNKLFLQIIVPICDKMFPLRAFNIWEKHLIWVVVLKLIIRISVWCHKYIVTKEVKQRLEKIFSLNFYYPL